MNGHQVELLKDQQEYLRTIEESKEFKQHEPIQSLVEDQHHEALPNRSVIVNLFQWIKEHITRKKTMSNQELLESLTM